MARASLLLVAGVAFTSVAAAAPFTLGATIQAGSPFGSFELALGSTSASPAVSGQMNLYWLNGLNHDFQLSYNGATGTATLSANWLGVNPATTISWTIPGANETLARNWTVNTGGMGVTAENNTATNTQIRVRTISFTGPSFNGVGSPNLVANQNGNGAVTTSTAAPITFQTAAGNGSWVLDGQIRFTGLGFNVPGGATGNELRFVFDILSTEVPEPATLLLGALGLAALGVLRHLRTTRRANPGKAPVVEGPVVRDIVKG